jgi:hypothetical protein
MSKKPKTPPVTAFTVEGRSYPVAKVVSVDIVPQRLYLEEMADGRWRLTYTKGLVKDVSALSAILLHDKAGVVDPGALYPPRRVDKLRNLAHEWRAEAETAHVDTADLLLKLAKQVEDLL